MESKIIRQNDKTTTIVKGKNDTSEIVQTPQEITFKVPKIIFKQVIGNEEE